MGAKRPANYPEAYFGLVIIVILYSLLIIMRRAEARTLNSAPFVLHSYQRIIDWLQIHECLI